MSLPDILCFEFYDIVFIAVAYIFISDCNFLLYTCQRKPPPATRSARSKAYILQLEAQEAKHISWQEAQEVKHISRARARDNACVCACTHILESFLEVTFGIGSCYPTVLGVAFRYAFTSFLGAQLAAHLKMRSIPQQETQEAKHITPS